jgi:triosephosphate isomerase
MKPILVINFKTYKEATGLNALKLAKSIARADKNAIITAQAGDIDRLSKTKLKIYSQHVDFQAPGKTTGYIIIEDIKAQGASGTLLNHSEHSLDFNVLKKTLERCKENKIKTIVCVKNLNEAKKILALSPDMIAFEVPELIATGKAISKFKANSVKKFSKIVKSYNKMHKTKIKALCGAGISTSEDVKSSLELGCQGVLASSAVIKSKNPEKLIREMSSLVFK